MMTVDLFYGVITLFFYWGGGGGLGHSAKEGGSEGVIHLCSIVLQVQKFNFFLISAWT